MAVMAIAPMAPAIADFTHRFFSPFMGPKDCLRRYETIRAAPWRQLDLGPTFFKNPAGRRAILCGPRSSRCRPSVADCDFPKAIEIALSSSKTFSMCRFCIVGPVGFSKIVMGVTV